MREKGRVFQQSNRFEQGRRGARSGHRIALSILAGTVTLVLTSFAICSFSMVPRSAYAMSDCGVLILCPSPTPGPSPTPTSNPSPTPRPTPTPTPRPTPTATPTVRPSVTPASSPTTGTQSPVPTVRPTRISGPAQKASYSPHQQGNDENPYLLVIIAATFVFLLLALGAGLLIFRHMLLPRIDVKLPPSGARAWSRFRVPNPRSLVADSETQIIWEIPSSTQTGTNPSSFQLSRNLPAFANDTGVYPSWGAFPVPADPKPSLFDSGAFLESILAASQNDPSEDERETSISEGEII